MDNHVEINSEELETSDVINKIINLNVSDEYSIKSLKNYLSQTYGEKEWVKKITTLVENNKKLAYNTFFLVENFIDQRGALLLSEIISSDTVSGSHNRSVIIHAVPKLIDMSDSFPSEDRHKIINNLSQSLKNLTNLLINDQKLPDVQDRNWLSELARQDIYKIIEAQILYGDTDPVEKLISAINPKILGSGFVEQLNDLRENLKAKENYYPKHLEPPITTKKSKTLDLIANGDEWVINNLSSSEQLNVLKEICGTGDVSYIIDNFKKFDKTDYSEIIDLLIVNGYAADVIKRITSFPDTDPQDLARVLIRHHQSDFIFDNEMFEKIEKKKLVRMFVDFGQLNVVMLRSDQFSELDPLEISSIAINMGRIDDLVKCILFFPKGKQTEVISNIVNSGLSSAYIVVIEGCRDIDQSILINFIKAGRGQIVLNNLKRFNITDPAAIIDTVIDHNPSSLFKGWEIFAKNNGIDINNYFDKLIQIDEAGLILSNISLFNNVDLNKVSNVLLESLDFNSILSNWDNLKKYIKTDTVVNLLIEDGNYSKLFDSLNVLNITNTKFLFDKLESLGKESVIVEYVSYFPEADVDELLVRMIENGQLDDVLPYLDDLKAKNHKFLVEKMISENKSGILYLYLDVLSGLDLGNILSIDGLNANDYISIFERLPEQSLSDADLKVLVQRYSESFGGEAEKHMIRRLYSQHFYQELYKIVSALPEKFSPIFAAMVGDEDEILSRIKEQNSQGNLTSVESLVKLSTLVGWDVTNKIEGVTFLKTEDYHLSLASEREKYKEVDINREIALFYLDEFIRSDLYGLKTALSVGIFPHDDPANRHNEEGINKLQDLEFSRLKDRILYKELENLGVDQVRKMIAIFREYLIVACSSEMGHQDQVHDRDNDIVLNGQSRYRHNSSESIRLYFSRCRDRFNKSGWLDSFGGHPWANIAQCGVDVWSDSLDISKMIFLIDRIIDIQHNSGRIFDKDRRISFLSMKLESFLDFRKKSSGIDSLLDYCLRGDLITKEEFDKYKEKSDLVAKLRNFNLSPVRRELSE